MSTYSPSDPYSPTPVFNTLSFSLGFTYNMICDLMVNVCFKNLAELALVVEISNRSKLINAYCNTAFLIRGPLTYN
jgi:hypothetical protein